MYADHFRILQAGASRMITGLRRQAIMARLASYWRFGASVLAYTLLAILWAEGFGSLPATWRRASRIYPPPACESATGRAACRNAIFPSSGQPDFWRARVSLTRYTRPPCCKLAGATFYPANQPLAWYYPPPALLLVTPVSWLPFEAGFYVWLLALAAAAAALLRAARLPWR